MHLCLLKQMCTVLPVKVTFNGFRQEMFPLAAEHAEEETSTVDLGSYPYPLHLFLYILCIFYEWNLQDLTPNLPPLFFFNIQNNITLTKI